LKTLLDAIKENIDQRKCKVIEVIRPVRFFSDGVILETAIDGEIVTAYVTDWFINLRKGDYGFDWQSDMPFFLSRIKMRLRRIITAIDKNFDLPDPEVRLPYKHCQLVCEQG
jgi:hypothetical protein